MPINSRRKGQSGEREVVHILEDQLGIKTTRNLDQWRDGGADLVGLEPWVVEIKRAKAPNLKSWWEQAVRQAEGKGIPCLWYRIDRHYWRVVIPLSVLAPWVFAVAGTGKPPVDLIWTAEISPEAFCMFHRENMEQKDD
jgi:hypothetical protein